MWRQSLILVVFLSYFTGYIFSANKIPCTLQWKPMMRGEPIPENAVPTHGNQNFIARSIKSNSIGMVENKTGVIIIRNSFDDDDYRVYPSSYCYILTNPNDCALSWETTEEGGTIPEQHLAVRSGSGYIAKMKYNEAEYAALLIKDFAYYVAKIIILEQSIYGAMRTIAGPAPYLKSTINLRCALDNFDFGDQSVPEGEPDFLGMDVIINEADTIVTQTVVHSRTLKESYSLTEATSFKQVDSWEIGLQIPTGVPGLEVGIDFKHEKFEENSESETIGHQTEKEVTSSRTVIVPPFSSVEICSIVYIPDGETTMPYTARAKYSIKGYSYLEVYDYLRKENITGLIIKGREGNTLIAEVTGNLAVSVPSTTKFIITPKEDENGCASITGKIYELKRAKAFGRTKIDVENIRADLKKMIALNILKS